MGTHTSAPTGGHIVKQGTPPPHNCALGRPPINADFRYHNGVEPDTVWHCGCGTYYKATVINVTDYEGDPYGTEGRWIRVKNANGDEYERVEIPPDAYLTTKTIGAHCTRCDKRVTKKHRHHAWV